MLALVIGAAVAAAPVGLFIAISAGRLQAYLIHLAPQRQTLLAEFAGRVPDLYLRSGVAQRQAAFDAGWARGAMSQLPGPRTSMRASANHVTPVRLAASRDAIDGLLERVADLWAIRLRQLAAARSVPRAHEDHRARSR